MYRIQSKTHDILQEEKTAVVEIKLKRGESVEKALRRLKKKMDKEGTMKEIRGHRYFEKPSEKRRRKAARAKVGLRINTRMTY
jgi:small subunit ribosomal protein S21